MFRGGSTTRVEQIMTLLFQLYKSELEDVVRPEKMAWLFKSLKTLYHEKKFLKWSGNKTYKFQNSDKTRKFIQKGGWRTRRPTPRACKWEAAKSTQAKLSHRAEDIEERKKDQLQELANG